MNSRHLHSKSFTTMTFDYDDCDDYCVWTECDWMLTKGAEWVYNEVWKIDWP